MERISLAAARKNANLTQERAAKELGVSVPTLIKWEKKKVSPPLDKCLAMQEIYNQPLESMDLKGVN